MKTKQSDLAAQIRIGAGLTRYILRATFRNKAGYFFSLLFPLLFVTVFGLFSTERPHLDIGVSDRLPAHTPVLRAVQAAANGGDSIRLVHGSDAELREQVHKGKIAGALAPAIGDPSGVRLIVAGDSAGSMGARSFFRTLVAEMNLRAAGITDPAFRLHVDEIPAKTVRHFDFILPGQIGFSMLSLATFGVAFSLSTLRKTLVLKRMFATSVRPITFLVAQGLSRSVQAMFQTTILLAVGVAVFHFTLSHGWLTFVDMLALAFLGILSFIGFGILITNLTDDDQSLPVVLNLFNLPQVMLAGVFFPIDVMPKWVQYIGGNLPLAYLNTSLRKAALEGAGLITLSPYILGMLAWATVAYILAARTFRAE